MRPMMFARELLLVASLISSTSFAFLGMLIPLLMSRIKMPAIEADSTPFRDLVMGGSPWLYLSVVLCLFATLIAVAKKMDKDALLHLVLAQVTLNLLFVLLSLLEAVLLFVPGGGQ